MVSSPSDGKAISLSTEPIVKAERSLKCLIIRKVVNQKRKQAEIQDVVNFRTTVQRRLCAVLQGRKVLVAAAQKYIDTRGGARG